MDKCNTFAYDLKRGVVRFCEKICIGLTRPEFKSINDMLYGLLKGQSVKLSEIARSLCEEIPLAKTVTRLSRNLTGFRRNMDRLQRNYLAEVKPFVDDETIFCIDPSDITKRYSHKQEGLCSVYDGDQHKMGIGWPLLEITALTHGNKLPIPVYSRLYSTEENGAEGETEEIIEGIRYINNAFGNIGIKVMDRGMDNKEIYRFMMRTEQRFVVRAKTNRNVFVNGESTNILDVAKHYRGKSHMAYTDKYGKHHKLKVSYVPVSLPELPDMPMVLVIVHGFDPTDGLPMLLLTNMDASGKEKSLRIVKTYLSRWRIEEYNRFKKNQFCLEYVRVQSLDSLASINTLVSILTGYLILFSERGNSPILLSHVLSHAKRLYSIPSFSLYAIADGIFDILSKTFSGIHSFLRILPRSQQLSLFPPSLFHIFTAVSA